MKPTVTACLLSLLVVLAACDGGSRGSGITTAEGNVATIDDARRDTSRETMLARLVRSWDHLWSESRAEAASGVAGVRVSIDGTSVSDVTDDSGAFRLRGDFGGDAVLRFETPGGGTARIAVNAPAGGTLTLEQVRVHTASGAATPDRQAVVFDGLVASPNCAASRIDLVSRSRGATDTDVYAVTLEGSTIRDERGSTVECATLREGDALHVQAIVAADGTFGEADLVLER